jgi:hypothetical protein
MVLRAGFEPTQSAHQAKGLPLSYLSIKLNPVAKKKYCESVFGLITDEIINTGFAPTYGKSFHYYNTTLKVVNVKLG